AAREETRAAAQAVAEGAGEPVAAAAAAGGIAATPAGQPAAAAAAPHGDARAAVRHRGIVRDLPALAIVPDTGSHPRAIDRRGHPGRPAAAGPAGAGEGGGERPDAGRIEVGRAVGTAAVPRVAGPVPAPDDPGPVRAHRHGEAAGDAGA